MTATAFTDFGKKDEYSPKLAMGNTKDIMPLLKEREQKYYALSNYGEVSNWIQQFFTCKDNGIIPILGMETYVNNYRVSGTGGDLLFTKCSNNEVWTKNVKEVSDDEKDLSTIDYNLDLFALTMDGYYNIIQIHNDAQINGVAKRPRTNDKFLKTHGKGIVAIMPTPYSEISSLAFNELNNEALEKYNFYKSVFDDVYLAVTMIEADDYKEINDAVISFCLKNNIKMIPVINSHYNLQSDEKHFDVFRKLSQMRGGMTYDVDLCPKMYYKTKEEVKELWYRVLKTDVFTENVLNALFSSLDELCARFSLLELDTSIKMPKFVNGVAILREKAFAGLKARGYDKDPKYVERLEYELDNVTRAGFSDYFLLLEDLARWHVDVKKRMFQIGRGCFEPMMRVRMEDYFYKYISDINIGDKIISGEGNIREVEDVFVYDVDEDMIELELDDGRIIKCTLDHEIKIKREGFILWIKAKDIIIDSDEIIEIIDFI